MKMPLVSVLMPVYNASQYLMESIESVLQQSFTDFEFVIVDDGSTDDSVSVIKTYDDSRIRLIRNEHDFILSLNMGIKRSVGKYVARMDSDDLMLPDRLQKQVDYMEEHPDIAVCGSYAEFFGVGTGMMRGHSRHKDLISDMLLYNPLIHPSVMMRRVIFENHEYKRDYPCAEDYKLWTDLAMGSLRFSNIPEILLKYRRSENQVTHTRWQEVLLSTRKIQLEYVEYVMEQIVKIDKKYLNFMNELIQLYNNELIGNENLFQVVHAIYVEVLR
jgi:glycosyltransferase involved in cell wall biosynthesis